MPIITGRPTLSRIEDISGQPGRRLWLSLGSKVARAGLLMFLKYA